VAQAVSGSSVSWAEGLSQDIIQIGGYGHDHSAMAAEFFLSHWLFVLDGVPWEADLEVIRLYGLVKKARAFKAPYLERDPAPVVQREVDRVIEHAMRLFPLLYPTFEHSGRIATSFRPMVTGPEPLHFDSYGGKHPLVTAYINVSNEARVYRIGHNFAQLAQLHPGMVKAAYAERRKPEDDASYPLRMRTQKGQPPLGPNAPRHEVRLAPGAIWFFNAKTVSHEVVYGTGAIGISWEVPGSGAQLQHDILKGLR
jgi:hypothetical protein